METTGAVNSLLVVVSVVQADPADTLNSLWFGAPVQDMQAPVSTAVHVLLHEL